MFYCLDFDVFFAEKVEEILFVTKIYCLQDNLSQKFKCICECLC